MLVFRIMIKEKIWLRKLNWILLRMRIVLNSHRSWRMKIWYVCIGLDQYSPERIWLDHYGTVPSLYNSKRFCSQFLCLLYAPVAVVSWKESSWYSAQLKAEKLENLLIFSYFFLLFWFWIKDLFVFMMMNSNDVHMRYICVLEKLLYIN